MKIGFFSTNKVCGLSPHAFSRKCIGFTDIDPVSAGLGVISNVGNWISQSKTRKLQKQMFLKNLNTQTAEAATNRNFQQNMQFQAQDFNAAQSKLAFERSMEAQQQAQAYNTSEREAAQQYNSATEQVNRARAAGLNPALTVGSQGAATVGAASSGATTSANASSSGQASGAQASPVSEPSLQAPQVDTGGLLQSLYYGKVMHEDLRAKQSQADMLANDALHRDLLNFYTIQKLKGEGKLNDKLTEVNELQRAFLEKTLGDRANLVQQQIFDSKQSRIHLAAQDRLLFQQERYQKMVNMNYPKEFAMRVSEYETGIRYQLQMIAESRSREGVNAAQVRTLDAQTQKLKADYIETMTRSYRNGYGDQNRIPISFAYAHQLAEQDWRVLNSEACKNNRTTFMHGFDADFGGKVGAGGSVMGIPVQTGGEVDLHGKATWWK